MLVVPIDQVNFVIISIDLIRTVNFPARIPGSDSHVPAHLDLFLWTLVFVLEWRSLHLEILIVLLSQFLLTSFQTKKYIQFKIDFYILHCKYQVKSHSSPRFLAVCVVALIFHRKNFRLHQQNKSYACKVDFRQASNRCKKIFEVAKLAYANKTK